MRIECEYCDEHEDLSHTPPLQIDDLLSRHKAIDMPEVCAAGIGNFRDFRQNDQVFTLSKGNTKAQNIISTISAESILITV